MRRSAELSTTRIETGRPMASAMVSHANTSFFEAESPLGFRYVPEFAEEFNALSVPVVWIQTPSLSPEADAEHLDADVLSVHSGAFCLRVADHERQ